MGAVYLGLRRSGTPIGLFLVNGWMGLWAGPLLVIIGRPSVIGKKKGDHRRPPVSPKLRSIAPEMAGATSSVVPALVICLLSLVLLLHRCRICGAVDRERTLAMIKPYGLSGNYTDKIKEAILESGFDIVQEAVVLLDAERASLFYAEHVGRSFFDSLVKYMTSGPVHAMVLERHDAITHWRALIGPTDARKAKASHPNRNRGT
ncbi:hypothetical protein ACQ4PT_025502 [Festuca glaucescens]